MSRVTLRSEAAEMQIRSPGKCPSKGAPAQVVVEIVVILITGGVIDDLVLPGDTRADDGRDVVKILRCQKCAVSRGAWDNLAGIRSDRQPWIHIVVGGGRLFGVEFIDVLNTAGQRGAAALRSVIAIEIQVCF